MSYKQYDHEDVVTEFHSSTCLTWVANILATICVFCLLMMTIVFIAKIPDSLITWLVLVTWGV